MFDFVHSWPLLLGWPAVALSVLVAWFGLARGSPRPLLAAAALVGPISAYLALTPRFFVWGLFPVGAYLGAAAATRRHHRAPAVALVVANAAFFAWLAVTIFG